MIERGGISEKINSTEAQYRLTKTTRPPFVEATRRGVTVYEISTLPNFSN